MSNVTIAAGGVIWRKNSKNEIEVVLVHRNRYEDWSLPKGKLDSGETLIGCASVSYTHLTLPTKRIV